MVNMEALNRKKERLELYYAREKEMLSSDGVKSYGIGSRNVTRYDTALKEIQDAIKILEREVTELEKINQGIKPRQAFGIVPRDW